MSKTIYVVTSGQYSDYGIECMFSNQEDAENYVKLYNENENKWDSADIEEWELDAMKGRVELAMKRKNVYTVVMDMDGNNPKVYVKSKLENAPMGKIQYFKGYAAPHLDINRQPTVQVHCEANNEAHAIKICNEKRLMWLANGGTDAAK